MIEVVALVIASIILGVSYGLIFLAALVLLNIQRDMKSGEYRRRMDELKKSTRNLEERIKS